MRILVLATLVPALALAGPGAGMTDGDILLAEVNGDPITLNQLLEEFRARHGGHLSMLTEERLVRRFLDSSIEEHLLIQEGERLEVDQDPRVTEGVRHLERRGRVDALLEERVQDAAVVSDEQVARALEALKTLHRLQWIRVRMREEAEEALARIREGESFAEIARELSIDATGVHGGDPGPFSWGMGPVELEQQIAVLEPGQMSGIFPVGNEFGLARLRERTTVELPEDLGDLEHQARKLLLQRRRAELKKGLMDTLREDAGVEIRDELLTPDSMRAALVEGAEDPVLARVHEAEIHLRQFAENFDPESWADVEPARVTRALRDRLQAMIDDMLLEREAERVGAGGAELELELAVALDRAVLLVLLGEIVYDDLKPGAEDLKRFYEEHPETFSEPDRIRVQHIVTADRERAEELRRRLQAQGQDGFAAAAREWSLDTDTAKRDGFVGWLEVRRLPEGMAERLVDLEPGDLSEVFESQAGFVLVRLVEHEKGELRPFEDVAEEVETAWLADAKRRVRAYWVDKLREVSEITIHDEAVSRAAVLLKARVERMNDPGTHSGDAAPPEDQGSAADPGPQQAGP